VRPEEGSALVVEADDYADAVIPAPASDSRVELWPPTGVRGRVVDGSGVALAGVHVGWNDARLADEARRQRDH
jgi:hypothetical protein